MLKYIIKIDLNLYYRYTDAYKQNIDCWYRPIHCICLHKNFNLEMLQYILVHNKQNLFQDETVLDIICKKNNLELL